jgi:hypothetical protein
VDSVSSVNEKSNSGFKNDGQFMTEIIYDRPVMIAVLIDYVTPC